MYGERVKRNTGDTIITYKNVKKIKKYEDMK